MDDKIFEKAFHDTPVREFHEVFGHPVSYDPNQTPDMKTRCLRVQMLATELVELARAFGVGLKISSEYHKDEDQCVEVEPLEAGRRDYDVVEAADALGDIRYITDGTNLVCGFPGEIVLWEIHSSNMSKLGEDGKPIYRADGKVMKGPNYFKPNIAKILGVNK